MNDFDLLAAESRKRLQGYLAERKPADPLAYLSRLEHELVVFNGSGYASIILIISDYITWAKANGVVVGPGRGSAAGSLVVFVMGITTIDPIEYHLIFERFLNPERVSLPDIDTDFSDRDAVIDYLKSKYGENRVAKVGVPSLFKPRSAIDQFARMLELDFASTKRITKLIGDHKTFNDAYGAEPDLVNHRNENAKLFELAERAVGDVRQITTHPSAVILTKGPIGREIPMQKGTGEAGKKGQLITGWDGEELDGFGYVKLDILTIDNLRIINNTIEMLPEDQRPNFYDLPTDDYRTLKGFERGETVGVFQFEEAKSVEILKRLPNPTFQDVYAVNALIRPGLDVQSFVEARNNPASVSYIVPELEPILGETYGVILYQEQVMRIMTDLGGFTMAEADKVRKIIAKTANQRSSEGLAPVHDKFRAGYEARGLDMGRFQALWDRILACQNYIFNKSHAVCYGYIAYADMFLKQHWPLQFMCAALQVRSKELYVGECRRLGIDVLGPNVNESEANYSIEGDAIRMGLSCIKHVGAKAKTIVARRPYQDEFDFFERAKPNTKQMSALVFGGALDTLDKGDREGLASRFCDETKGERVGVAKLAMAEHEALGFYLAYNPLSGLEDKMHQCVTATSATPVHALVGGMISRIHIHEAKTGPMAFMELLTLDGEVSVVMWPSDYKTERKKLAIGNVVMGTGKRTDRGNYAINNLQLLRSL